MYQCVCNLRKRGQVVFFLFVLVFFFRRGQPLGTGFLGNGNLEEDTIDR